MVKPLPPRHRYTGHQVHLVAVQECQRCGAHVVFRAVARQVAAHPTAAAARAAAEKLRRSLVGYPDPGPLLVIVEGDSDTASIPRDPAAVAPAGAAP